MKIAAFKFRGAAALIALGAISGAARAEAIHFPAGKATFDARCAVCHQAGGKGQDGLAPPLTAYPGHYAASAQGRHQLPDTVLHGMYGEIRVADKTYNFKMPNFDSLSDDELAQVLNYVVFDLNGSSHGAAKPFTAAEIKASRAKSMDAGAVYAQRAAVTKALGLR
ncbi:c-type cytochrome [Paraburkholderia sacchari]|uniref:c-type cytochrome n=1 Tax=Paraburkholderia sacchari TaxID=159450 RepID=UPI00054347F8|nr:cytochrome c [Paraburkholderia sacchari]NLP62628.1 cytochrome c [Paraburkholderia sacchari]